MEGSAGYPFQTGCNHCAAAADQEQPERQQRTGKPMKQHTYYRTCERCGALLDPNEICTCARDQRRNSHSYTIAEADLDLKAKERIAEIRANLQGMNSRSEEGLRPINAELQHIIMNARRGLKS